MRRSPHWASLFHPSGFQIGSSRCFLASGTVIFWGHPSHKIYVRPMKGNMWPVTWFGITCFFFLRFLNGSLMFFWFDPFGNQSHPLNKNHPLLMTVSKRPLAMAGAEICRTPEKQTTEPGWKSLETIVVSSSFHPSALDFVENLPRVEKWFSPLITFLSFCNAKVSCTATLPSVPIIDVMYKVSTIPGGAGFLPSTECPMFYQLAGV